MQTSVGAAEEKNRTKPSQVRSSGALSRSERGRNSQIKVAQIIWAWFSCPQALLRTSFLGSFRCADRPELRRPSFRFGLRLRLPSAYFLCIIEHALSNREAQWRVLEAKTNEMQSSTPQPAYLRSAVLPLPQRQRYQNKLASPRGLCLRTSRPKMI
jgi:hypothetical protein